MSLSSIDLQGRSLDKDLKKHLPLGQHDYLPEYKERLAGVLVSKKEIDEALDNCAKVIAQEYLEKGIKTVLTMYVLKGARYVFDYLGRQLFNEGLKTIEDVIAVNRYSQNIEGGIPRISVTETEAQPGDCILIFEDIFDEGRTLNYIAAHLRINKPASIKLFSLLFKPGKYKGDLRIHYPVFKVDDHWFVGRGMDLNCGGRPMYRELPFVAVANPDYLLKTGQIKEEKAEYLRNLIKFE